MSKKAVRKLRVGVVVDPIGTSYYDYDMNTEITDIVERVQDITEIACELVVGGNGMHVVKDAVLDLLVIDYGGMCAGADDGAVWQIQDACRWADNHPGRLVLLWTDFTRRFYQRELEDAFGHLDNIKAHYSALDDCEWIKWFIGGNWEPCDPYLKVTKLHAPERRRKLREANLEQT